MTYRDNSKKRLRFPPETIKSGRCGGATDRSIPLKTAPPATRTSIRVGARGRYMLEARWVGQMGSGDQASGGTPTRLWGGRFEGGPADALARLSLSVQVDWRGGPEDRAGCRGR